MMDLMQDEDDVIARGPTGVSGGIDGPGPPPGELVLLVMHLVIDVDAGIKPPRRVTVEETMGESWGNKSRLEVFSWMYFVQTGISKAWGLWVVQLSLMKIRFLLPLIGGGVDNGPMEG